MKSLRWIYIICLEGKESYSEKNFFKSLNGKFSDDKNYKENLLNKFGILGIKVFGVKVLKEPKKNPFALSLKLIAEEIKKKKQVVVLDTTISLEYLICFLIDRDITAKEEIIINQLNNEKENLKAYKKKTKIKDFWWLLYPPNQNFEFLPICCFEHDEVKKIKINFKENINKFLKSKEIDKNNDIKAYNAEFLKKIKLPAEEVLNNLTKNLNHFENQTTNCSCNCPVKAIPLNGLIQRVSFLNLFSSWEI